MCCMMGHTMDHAEGTPKSSVEGGRQDSLLDVLRRRYAAGEISRDQLEEMKRVLELSDDRAVDAGGNPWAASHHG